MKDSHTNIQSVRFKKGDAFVQCKPDYITFMEINEVDESTDYMDFCTVTWYSCRKGKANIQRRFPMAARDGKFCDFKPISRYKLKQAKRAIREYDAKAKSSSDLDEILLSYIERNKYLRNMIGDEVKTTPSLPSKEKIASLFYEGGECGNLNAKP